MEFLGDILEKLLPAVFLISTFLLPAFLKKKKKQKQKEKESFLKPTSGQAGEGRSPAGLEEKIKQQFDRIRAEKQRVSKKAPQQAAPLGRTATPPISRPSLAEPLRPSSRPPVQAKTRPAAQKRPSPEPVESLGSSPVGDAYRTKTDAYGDQADTPALGEAQKSFSGSRLSGERKSLIAPLGRETASRAGEDSFSSQFRGLDERSETEYGQAEAGDEEMLNLHADRLTLQDLRKAIVLREILGRPVGLKGFCSEQIW